MQCVGVLWLRSVVVAEQQHRRWTRGLCFTDGRFSIDRWPASTVSLGVAHVALVACARSILWGMLCQLLRSSKSLTLEDQWLDMVFPVPCRWPHQALHGKKSIRGTQLAVHESMPGPGHLQNVWIRHTRPPLNVRSSWGFAHDPAKRRRAFNVSPTVRM